VIEENPNVSQKKIAYTLFLHHDIVLASLKKKSAQIPDPNPEKGRFLHLDNARPHLASHEI
jgi:hypothetical protein